MDKVQIDVHINFEQCRMWCLSEMIQVLTLLFSKVTLIHLLVVCRAFVSAYSRRINIFWNENKNKHIFTQWIHVTIIFFCHLNIDIQAVRAFEHNFCMRKARRYEDSPPLGLLGSLAAISWFFRFWSQLTVQDCMPYCSRTI